MPGVVVDTHAIVWYLSEDPRLSAKAAEALDSATAAGEFIPHSINLSRRTDLPGRKRTVCLRLREIG